MPNPRPVPKFQRPSFRRKSFGEKLSFFAGPDLTRGAQSVGTLLHGLLEFATPAGDIKQTVEESGNLSRATMKGDVPGMISGAAGLGAGILGAALPVPPTGKTKGILEQIIEESDDIAKSGGAKIRPARILSKSEKLPSDISFGSPVNKIKASPEDASRLGKELASAQRGAPEQAMLKVQFASGGGVLNPIVENVGDLTHRASELIDRGIGLEFFGPKVKSSLDRLKNPFGFEKEMSQNIINNARTRGVSIVEQREKIDRALKIYADEHRKLPVFNKVQFLSREAAVAVGEKRWNDAVKNLEALDDIIESGNFDKIARDFFVESK